MSGFIHNFFILIWKGIRVLLAARWLWPCQITFLFFLLFLTFNIQCITNVYCIWNWHFNIYIYILKIKINNSLMVNTFELIQLKTTTIHKILLAVCLVIKLWGWWHCKTCVWIHSSNMLQQINILYILLIYPLSYYRVGGTRVETLPRLLIFL